MKHRHVPQNNIDSLPLGGMSLKAGLGLSQPPVKEFGCATAEIAYALSKLCWGALGAEAARNAARPARIGKGSAKSMTKPIAVIADS